MAEAVPVLVTLNNGISMPALGFGTFEMEPGAQTYDAVQRALRLGYRLVDTAAMYGNEAAVGKAVRDSGLPRDEVFVTTKLWNGDHGYREARRAFQNSLEALELDYVDLYLIHWPVPGGWRESWRALCEIVAEGRCRAIGVSNFTERHLEALERDFEVPPAVNQVEFHPFVYSAELLQACQNRKIALQAYSPLVRAQMFGDPLLERLSQKYRKSPAQILVRWGLEHGLSVLPKSVTPARISENFEVKDFELSSAEVQALDNLSCDFRVCWNPYELTQI